MEKGDWLWKLANIEDKDESAAVYVGRFVTVHNPLFFVHELWPKELMQHDRNNIERYAPSRQQKHLFNDVLLEH